MSTTTRRTQEYEKIREHIITRMLSQEQAQQIGEPFPGVPFGDMIMAYQVEKSAGIYHTITDYDLAYYGVTEENLRKDTLKNAACKNPIILERALLGPHDPSRQDMPTYELFCFSARDPRYGASMIVYPEMMRVIALIIRKDYYILACSADDFLIIPEVGPGKISTFANENDCKNLMVQFEGHISENIYHYQLATNTLEKAPEFAGRMMLQAMFPDKGNDV